MFWDTSVGFLMFAHPPQLPLLEALCQDESWHVRHSALFALPATLARLTPNQRRAVALRVIIPLSEDCSSNVRTAVLEALGEVLYTFHEDKEGVPPELLELFLGRKQDPLTSSTVSSSSSRKSSNEDWSDHYPSWALESSALPREEEGANDADIWNDPTRPLICAFNYPALALTLGKERWGELRELYLELSTSLVVKVRCTLAASLGELARILGAGNAHNDLMQVFKSSITAEEGEVRLKAIEALELFVAEVGDEDRWKVLEVLLSAWDHDRLRGWREREGVVKLLSILSGYQYDIPAQSYWRGRQLRDLLLKGLVDGVASVRDAAISVVPSLFFGWRSREHRLWGELVQDLARMATDGKYSRRTTFVATQQKLLLHEPGAESLLEDEVLQIALERLASDHIPGVRIGVARLIKLVCGKRPRFLAVKHHLTACDTDKYYPTEKPQWVLSAIGILSRDESKDARAFAIAISQSQSATPTPNDMRCSACDVTTPAQHTFSRPPPPSIGPIEIEVPPIGFEPTQTWDSRNHADAVPSPTSSLSTLKNGCEHETKSATSKTKDGAVGRPGLPPRTKNGRVSR
jgi:serine/threonine-protein phosphatase 4 regulatory subunit 1